MISKLFLDIPAYVALIPVIYSIVHASYLDYKYRKIPLKTWYPALFGVGLSIVTFIIEVQSGWINTYWAAMLLMSASIVIIASLGFSYFGAFGGADAIAIGVMTLSAFYISLNEFFVMSFVKNIFICCFTMILLAFILNIKDGNAFDKHKKLSYLFLARKLYPDNFKNAFGVVLQNGNETTANTLKTINYESSPYNTKNIEINTYYKNTKYWVLYSIPFVIPISAAFIITILLGDLFKYI